MKKRKKQIRVSKPKPKVIKPVVDEIKLRKEATKDFNAALETLGLTVASKPTSKALGLSVRHVQRIAGGEAPVPEPVALLLEMYLQYGLKHIQQQQSAEAA